jgi:glycosyltransferase involved in cell wall biosynthesis
MQHDKVKEKCDVLFLINSLGRGGAEKVFCDQANYLYKQGYNINFFVLFMDQESFQKSNERLQLPKQNVVNYDLKTIKKLRKIIKIILDIRREKFKIVYSTLNEANLISRLSALFNWRSKYIIREANTVVDKKYIFKIVDFITNWRIKNIIALSQDTLESLILNGVSANKITVLPNGVDIPKEGMDYKVNDTINILSVGSLTKQKNNKHTIKILSKLQRDGLTDFKYYIAGEGGERNNIQDSVVSNNLENHVALLGLVRKQDLDRLYQNSDIFILDSLWEGCPNVLLEAMSYGLPCIATAVGGSKDIIESKVSGLLYEVGDDAAVEKYLTQLIQDHKARTFLGKNARNRISTNYSMEENLEKLMLLFNSI